MKVKFLSPFDEETMVTKTIKVENTKDGFTFNFTACGGRHFCLERFSDGNYKFSTANDPADPWDWREYDEEEFSVVE